MTSVLFTLGRHNRGLNSVPLGGRWMAWGEAPLKVSLGLGLGEG